MTPVISRFAPSPTGPLHLGHAWSAICAHDRARADGGRFLLRIEDIDGTRSRPEHVERILADLAWLGLEWDEAPVFQSRRLDRYASALAQLQETALVYPCFCTRAEIAASLSAPHGAEAIYPGTCRHLGGPERLARMQGERFAWRLDMTRAIETIGVDLHWHDELAGRQRVDADRAGDVVLARKDAPASYHLAVTIDDAAQAVSHVVRGADLLEATHVHRVLQALLGLPTPVYRHHALLGDADGHRLAKRTGAPALAMLRTQGVDGRTLANDLRNGRLPIGFTRLNA